MLSAKRKARHRPITCYLTKYGRNQEAKPTTPLWIHIVHDHAAVFAESTTVHFLRKPEDKFRVQEWIGRRWHVELYRLRNTPKTKSFPL